jgi:CoA:oxalate CoA-transferase
MTKLLEGVRVLDLTNVLAGPFCSYQLAMLGAEVIKVEVPGTGDLARQLGANPELNAKFMGVSFLAQNAGKKSVTLNLKMPRGRSLFLDLVDRADVVLENFRPGIMDRLGVGYEVLRERNPSIVYCAISGFGQDGPMRDNPAYDQIIQGFSGVMSVTGSADTGPLRVGYPVADSISGLTAAFGIAAALVRRGRTGEGEFIDVSMLESTMVTMGWVVSNYLTAGVVPARMGNDNMTASPSGTFRTADGPLNIAANKQEQFITLCQLLDREDLASDQRFANRETRKRNRVALTAEIERSLAARSALEWEELLTRNGVPAGRVMSVPDILDHRQIKEREFIQSIPDVPGVDRPLSVVRGGFRLASGDPRAESAPPVLGADNAAVFGELGISEMDLKELYREGVV